MESNMSQDLNLNLENTSWERIDGEIIVISYNTGKYYSVNKQGSDLLHLIEMKVKKEFWYEILKSNFRNFDEESKTTQIIDEFILKCLNEKLLINGVLNIEKIELPNDYARDNWESPELRIFDDLTDILLIDPVHDTSLEGWPNLKNDD
jgi:hypothetical protein